MEDVTMRANPKRALEELIASYWDLAYAEGSDGRKHDTESGDAQACWLAIQGAIMGLRDLALEEAARLCDARAIKHGEHRLFADDSMADGAYHCAAAIRELLIKGRTAWMI